MIYSPKASPSVNKSHIHEVPKNNGFIFHMGEVSELWHKAMVTNSRFQFEQLFNSISIGNSMVSRGIWDKYHE